MTVDSGTYDEATQRRKMAAALLGQTLKPEENVKHWAQGLANLAKAGIGGYMGYQANQEAAAEKAKGQAELYTALGLPAPAAPAEQPGMFSKIGALLSGSDGSMPSAAPDTAGLPSDQASYPPHPAAGPAPTTFRPGIAAPAPAAPDATLPRGLRNNNPLNIEAGDFTRGQPGFVGSDGRFARFETPEQGTAAASKLLDTYESKYGLNTPAGIIGRWAPQGENNSAAYAATIAKKLGIGVNDPITPEMRPRLIAAMAEVENGRPALPPEIANGQSIPPSAGPGAVFNSLDAAANPPQIASALAAPPTAAPAGVLANVPQETKVQIARLLTSNNPTAKAMGAALLQNAISDKVTYQTTPDGDILAMDPHGRTPPKVVYKAGAKPIAVPENSQLYDPSTKSFIGGGSAPIPTSVPGPDGKSIPIPQGLSPKDAREFTKHVTQSTADAATGKMTEVQGNAQQFANRMEAAQASITPELEKEALGLSGAAQQVAGKIPIIGSALQSEAYQKYSQAKSQFITAVLRKESGAAISKEEFNRYDREFFPQPGDKPETIAQKAKERQVALDAMRRVAGPAYKPADVTKPARVTKTIGGKNYYQENGQWFEE